jgi:hypothetical protein
LSKNGQTKGKHNAWSYIVSGKTPLNKEWHVTIKKSTFTSGNLLLSSEYQSLQFEERWIAKNFISDCPTFKIAKSKWSDFFLSQKHKESINLKVILSFVKTIHISYYLI